MIKWLEKNRIIPIILTILITIEIFYFSTLQGGTGTGVENPWIARAYHFIVFFLFSFFFLMAIKGKNKMKLKYLIITIIISITHGILDEVHQIFVPLRDASIRDILTDSLGIFSAVLIHKYIDKKTKIKSETSS